MEAEKLVTDRENYRSDNFAAKICFGLATGVNCNRKWRFSVEPRGDLRPCFWHTAVFKRGAHFLEPTCLPNTRILLYKSVKNVQLCWWYKICWSKQWFLDFARACIWVIFVFKRVARWGDIFTHKSHNEEGASFYYYLSFAKKEVFLESKSLIKNYLSFTADSNNLC